MSDDRMQGCFTDVTGKRWTMKIDVATIARIKQIAGVDLARSDRVVEEIQRIAGDVVLLVQVIQAIVDPKFDESFDVFAERFSGDSLEHATRSFLTALAFFFPSNRCKLLNRFIQAMDNLNAQSIEKANQAMDRLEREGIES